MRKAPAKAKAEILPVNSLTEHYLVRVICYYAQTDKENFFCFSSLLSPTYKPSSSHTDLDGCLKTSYL